MSKSTISSDSDTVTLSRREYDALRARAGDLGGEDIMTERILAERSDDVAIPEHVWQEIEKTWRPIGPLRKWRGLTQAQLAAKAGLTQAYLSELEAGKKIGEVGTLRMIATALGVGIEDVLLGEPQ